MKKILLSLVFVLLGSSCTAVDTTPATNTNITTPVVNETVVPTVLDDTTSDPDIAVDSDDDFILTDIDPSEVNYSGSTTASTITGQIDLASIEHTRGTGDITILEYGDTECPYTQTFQPTMQQVLADYDGQVQWSYKHFPLNQHTKAPFEAEATECAGAQGKFWEYLDQLYAITPSNNELPPQELMTIAETVGLNLDQFSECLRSATYKSTVQADSAEIQALGGNSTPISLVLDSQGQILTTIRGSLSTEQVQQALEPYLP